MLINPHKKISDDDWEECKRFFNYECAYCGSNTPNLIREHVNPTGHFGIYLKYNIVPACRSCNVSKSNKPIKIWFEYCRCSEERIEKMYDWMAIQYTIFYENNSVLHKHSNNKVLFCTQIRLKTWHLLNKYLERSPSASKAEITAEALKEYIISRTEKKEGGN